MAKPYLVSQSIEHPEKNRCVDIVQQQDGKYRFQEWRRDIEDTSGWILLFDSQPVVFNSEGEAMSAATLRCNWSRKDSGLL
jgi:hypothetical protein